MIAVQSVVATEVIEELVVMTSLGFLETCLSEEVSKLSSLSSYTWETEKVDEVKAMKSARELLAMWSTVIK